MSTIRNTRTNRRLAITLAAALGLGALGFTAPAGAEIGDLCGDVVNGCPEEIDDFTNPTGDPDPEPDPDPDPELPPADFDDVIVADPTFTG